MFRAACAELAMITAGGEGILFGPLGGSDGVGAAGDAEGAGAADGGGISHINGPGIPGDGHGDISAHFADHAVVGDAIAGCGVGLSSDKISVIAASNGSEGAACDGVDGAVVLEHIVAAPEVLLLVVHGKSASGDRADFAVGFIFQHIGSAGKGATGDQFDLPRMRISGIIHSVSDHTGEVSEGFGSAITGGEGAPGDLLDDTAVDHSVPGISGGAAGDGILSLLAAGEHTAGDLGNGAVVVQNCLAMGDHIHHTAAGAVQNGQGALIDDGVAGHIGQGLAVQVQGEDLAFGDGDIFCHISEHYDGIAVRGFHGRFQSTKPLVPDFRSWDELQIVFRIGVHGKPVYYELVSLARTAVQRDQIVPIGGALRLEGAVRKDNFVG